MKILPRNGRKALWFPNIYLGNIGWMHFERRDKSIDRLVNVPQEYYKEIKEHYMRTEEIIYCDNTWSNWKRFELTYSLEHINELKRAQEIYEDGLEEWES